MPKFIHGHVGIFKEILSKHSWNIVLKRKYGMDALRYKKNIFKIECLWWHSGTKVKNIFIFNLEIKCEVGTKSCILICTNISRSRKDKFANLALIRRGQVCF